MHFVISPANSRNDLAEKQKGKCIFLRTIPVCQQDDHKTSVRAHKWGGSAPAPIPQQVVGEKKKKRVPDAYEEEVQGT